MSTEYCSECGGKGIFAVPCETCTGRGIVHDSTGQTNCPDCEGSCHFLYVCLTCEGTGLLFGEHHDDIMVCQDEPTVRVG